MGLLALDEIVADLVTAESACAGGWFGMEAGTNPLPLPAEADGDAGQQHDRDRMAGHPFGAI